jgi:hypothetical protein
MGKCPKNDKTKSIPSITICLIKRIPKKATVRSIKPKTPKIRYVISDVSIINASFQVRYIYIYYNINRTKELYSDEENHSGFVVVAV